MKIQSFRGTLRFVNFERLHNVKIHVVETAIIIDAEVSVEAIELLVQAIIEEVGNGCYSQSSILPKRAVNADRLISGAKILAKTALLA